MVILFYMSSVFSISVLFVFFILQHIKHSNIVKNYTVNSPSYPKKESLWSDLVFFYIYFFSCFLSFPYKEIVSYISTWHVNCKTKQNRSKDRRKDDLAQETKKETRKERKGKTKKSLQSTVEEKQTIKVYISWTFTIIIITTAIITLTTILSVQIIIIIKKTDKTSGLSYTFFLFFSVFFKDHWTVVCSTLHLYRLIFCVSIVAS